MSCFTSSKIIFPNIIKQKNPRSAFHEKPWCFGLGWCGPHSSKMDRIGTFFPLEIRQPPIRRTFHTHPEMIFSHLCTKFCFGLKIFGLLTCYSPILWEWFLFGVFFSFLVRIGRQELFPKEVFPPWPRFLFCCISCTVHRVVYQDLLLDTSQTVKSVMSAIWSYKVCMEPPVYTLCKGHLGNFADQQIGSRIHLFWSWSPYFPQTVPRKWMLYGTVFASIFKANKTMSSETETGGNGKL